MKNFEFYPEFQDLFEYDGSNEIERVRIKRGRPIRRDCFVFGSVDEAFRIFIKRCGALEKNLNCMVSI